ncbi:MAG TPA: hypothetical protein IAA05_04645 [Candidatus Blautia excrementipullorum]|nr:hypothetical protein [Candidatus Blautia excrementipullorum]
MFGYVVMNKPEMKFKDFDLYRSFYCGLCRELRERYGVSGQITLTYDMTFVILLLSGLYEPPTRKGTTRCIVHPVQRQTVRKNEITEYAADMNIFLAYYKCVDDWKDDKKFVKLALGSLLRNKDKKAEASYRRKTAAIIRLLDELSAMEKAGEKDLDKMAGCFGRIMEEIFAYKEDAWEGTLRRMGFYMGKFIYIMDAFEDVEKDIEKGNYNPFKEEYIMEGFQERVKQILIMMMAEACREFEKLPIIKYAEILRNILYSGVWCRFETVAGKRKEKREK